MKMITRFSKLTLVMVIAYLGIAAVSSDHGKYFEISKNIEIFTNLYKEINTYYVDDIDPAKLMRTGVDAMLESLDPYTNFISESEIEGFRYITDGKYNGIGALIHTKDDKIVITEPYENCPAHKAGLKAGDIVLEIDGKNAAGKSTDDVSDILKGFPGTEIELKIKRPGVTDVMKITMTRDEVIVPNVPHYSFVADNIGYISLTTFTRDAGKHVADALQDLKNQNPNMTGVIFDLRGNGGGLLTEAVNVSNVFIPKGELVVTTKGKVIDWDRSFKTLNKSVDEEIPLVVLINKGSASASEIVSGVIQDLDRGVLIGQRSYGKGLVQNTRDVGYNSKVKLTTAKYYIPSGRCIQGVSYTDGTPIDIPDAERTAFKTRNGRMVLDGGGVKSDINLEETSGEGIIKNLLEKHLIFDYVTEYCVGKETIPAVENFTFTEFDAFVRYLDAKGFHYETETEKLLSNLTKKAEQEKLLPSVQSDINALQNKIQLEKKNELRDNKAQIVDLIEKEISSRYYFQKGKIMMSLKNDIEIKEAIAVLNDSVRYKKILSGK